MGFLIGLALLFLFGRSESSSDRLSVTSSVPPIPQNIRIPISNEKLVAARDTLALNLSEPGIGRQSDARVARLQAAMGDRDPDGRLGPRTLARARAIVQFAAQQDRGES